jgi:hypothetical protein
VNLTSNSIASAVPQLSHYMASKMGNIGFTRGLANDVAEFGHRERGWAEPLAHARRRFARHSSRTVGEGADVLLGALSR